MADNIESRLEGDIMVCAIIGRLDAVSAESTSSDLLSLIASCDSGKVLLDLAKLEYVSSLGLRVFVQAAKQLNGSGGTLKLCSATPPIQKVLEISALDSLLDLRDDVADALSAF